ncbi:helix-hairpin-helix domain-containing protein [Mucilaginibacter sp. BJC16-A38]|uniref:helix-hairpin-helix domain-containing protein n=1 Tax=Mucilaginibacter phenanthrenivorans TaxID=1234842 RepID=UPI0021589A67|nr:helix-hairpin-helix domain-containing protein [Mucilaginibacter phenanthrenivorans]MCR8557975.1 helix-hairpin-helix domain-containing protein [Mucilaginibacter phenanthrenivorans]
MKKTINYRLTLPEKQLLKTKKVSQKMLQDYAPDEIAALLEASTERARELNALSVFQSIPSLGINFAEELIGQGYYSLEQIKGRSAVELFDAFERHCGAWADPCVEDSYRLLVHYIENRDESKRWWHFTAERKAYREQYGFHADRPQKPWYRDEKYPKMNAYQRD